MPTPFLQIHFLTSFPATLLNRDDAGFAKRVPFGGAVRTRVSSQCLKRHWRTFEGEHALSGTGIAPSLRSRLTFEREVVAPLVAVGLDEAKVRAVVELLMVEVLDESAKAKSKDKSDGLKTRQITVLGRPEIDYLRGLTEELVPKIQAVQSAKKDLKDDLKSVRQNLKALRAPSQGLSAALFGRMVTSSILARSDAALHVAHAFTVHAQQDEPDYFSALDDLLGTDGEEELGSGHIGSTELTTGMFYGYVVVDVPLLVSNLTGCARKDWLKADRQTAADVVERVVHLVATVSPGAKLGSTAPYAYAQALMVEASSAQPRTLANAFLAPVSPRPDLRANTYVALGQHLSDLDEVYGRHERRVIAGLGLAGLREQVGAEDPRTLDDVAAWAAARVREAS